MPVVDKVPHPRQAIEVITTLYSPQRLRAQLKARVLDERRNNMHHTLLIRNRVEEVI